MPLYIRLLENVPQNPKRDHYIYLLDDNREKTLGKVLEETFSIRSGNAVPFEEKLLSKPLVNNLPAMLITHEIPDKLKKASSLKEKDILQHDLKLVFLPLKKHSTSTPQMAAAVQKIFNDIQEGKTLQGFKPGKSISKEEQAQADVLLLESAAKTKSISINYIADHLRISISANVPITTGINQMAHQIHFEDFSGNQFERLAFAFISRQKKWDSIQWLGQTGNDGGRDIWGEMNGETFCYQCANYRKLTFLKIAEDLDKLVKSKTIPDNYIVVAGAAVSADLRQKITGHAHKAGIPAIEIWSGVEFEEKIRYTTPDLLKRFVRGETLPEENQGLSNPAKGFDERIVNFISLFRSHNTKILSEEEFASAYDDKVKLYNLIFQEFDGQIDKTYKDKLSGVIFDRLLLIDNVSQTDIESINKIRGNRQYTYVDRSLLVSGITLCAFKQFNPKLVNLLLDFISDFEERVWKKALTGLILTLIKFENHLNSYPEIIRRLEEFKQNKTVQAGLEILERNLRRKTYSLKNASEEQMESVLKLFTTMMGHKFPFRKHEIDLINKELSGKDSMDGRIFFNIFNKEVILKLEELIGDQESVLISATDFFKIINIREYYQIFELNPLHFDLKDPFYQNARNWFTPFKRSIEIDEIVRRNFPSSNIDIEEFLCFVEDFEGIDSIDKHALIMGMKELQGDVLEGIYQAFKMIRKISQNEQTTEHFEYTKYLKEIYRFQALAIEDYTNNLFDKNLEMYGKSLLEKVADKNISSKISAIALYENEKYAESLEIMITLPFQKDLEMLELMIDSYFELGQYDKAEELLPYGDPIFESSEVPLSPRIRWLRKCRVIYSRLKKDKEYFDALAGSIFLQELNIGRNNTYAGNITDDIDELLESYWIASNTAYNTHQDVSISFFYLMRVLHIFTIRNLDEALYQKYVVENKELIIAGFSRLLYDDEFDIHVGLIEESDPSIFEKVMWDRVLNYLNILKIFRHATHTEINTIFTELPAIKEKGKILFDTMLPVFINIQNAQEGIENIITPFTGNNEEKIEILFEIKRFIAEKETYVISTCIKAITEELVKIEIKNLITQLILVFRDTTKPDIIYDQATLAEKITGFMLSAELPTSKDDQTETA